MTKHLIEQLEFKDTQGIDVYILEDFCGDKLSVCYVTRRTHKALVYYSLYDIVNNVRGCPLDIEKYDEGIALQELLDTAQREWEESN